MTNHGQRIFEIDLNRATPEELAALPMMDEVRLGEIVRLRPFRNWAELEAVFGRPYVDDLVSGGARLGHGRAADGSAAGGERETS